MFEFLKCVRYDEIEKVVNADEDNNLYLREVGDDFTIGTSIASLENEYTGDSVATFVLSGTIGSGSSIWRCVSVSAKYSVDGQAHS